MLPLTAVTLALLFVTLIVTDGDILSPAAIYCGVFLVVEILADFYVNIYDITIHANTFFIVVGSMVLFVLCTLLFYGFNKSSIKISKSKSNHIILVEKNIKIFFIVLQFIVLFFHMKYVYAIVGALGYDTSSIFTTAGHFHDVSLFKSAELTALNISVPKIYSLGYSLCMAYSYVCLYIIINNYLINKRVDKLLLTDVIIFGFESMLGGGRSDLFRFITAIIFITAAQTNVKIRKDSLKRIFWIGLIGVITVYIMLNITSLVGRTSNDNTTAGQWLYVYVSAPLQNLDTFLQKSVIDPTRLWGQETFHNIYIYIGQKTGQSKYIRDLTLPFMKHNGLNTGNVYTTFYQFYYDFGYSGVFLLISGIALFYNWLYFRIKKGVCEHTLGTIVYSYLFNDLIMLIFSNRFYETTLNIEFLKFIVYLSVLHYFLIKKHTRVRI